MTHRYESPKTHFEREQERIKAAAEDRKKQAEKQQAEYNKLINEIVTEGAKNYAAAKAEEEKAAAAQLVKDKSDERRNAALVSYIETTGSDAGFSLMWPSLEAEIIRDEVLAGLGQAKPITSRETVQRRLNLLYGQG